jgi:hypothetical protein
MKNLYKIQDELYIIDNNEKITQNEIWARCSFTGDILKNRNGQYAYKVILTTNKSLIKDGVQAIDDEFLEWFVKNSSCEFVKVQTMYFDKVFYEIIIPKEELKQSTKDRILSETPELVKQKVRETANKLVEPKQETLEEAVVKRINDNVLLELHHSTCYSFAEIGAKWQQEQDKYKLELAEHLYTVVYKEKERRYSEEEVFDLIEKAIEDKYANLRYWFEQFKKK